MMNIQKRASFSFMTAFLVVAVLGMLALLAALPAAAQKNSGGEVQAWEGYSFTLPDDWTVVEDDLELGLFATHPDDLTFYLVGSQTLAGSLEDDATLSPELLENALNNLFGNSGIDPDNVEVGELAGLDAATVFFGSDYDGLLGLLQLEDENGDAAFVYFEFTTPKGDFAEYEDRLTAILETLAVGEGGETASAGSGSSTASSAPAEPCFVSTTRADSTLRVGPGENRAAIAFLPRNGSFEVTGAFTADDDSQWFQLDRAEAAPNSAANEVWVARDDVDEEGDCDAVADAAAPPIIVGAPAQPTAVPSGGSGGSQPAEPAQPAAPAGGRPIAGTWTFNLNPTTNASCQGGQNVPFNTSEVFGQTSFRIYVAPQGTGLSFDGDLLSASGNGYFGTYSFDNGENTQVYITSVSANHLGGQVVGNFTIDNTPCSFTVGFSVTR